MGNFAEKAYAFTRENCSEFKPSRIIVAVSGGADSMCLLHVAKCWRGIGFDPIAVHVMHGIRGDEAQRDADFVKENCNNWNIPLHIVNADVPAVALQEHMGLEEAGRLVRYEALERLRRELSADFILTAHTASDAAETVLLNVMRGCGTSGLGGIPIHRDRILRPLLFAERADIERYCADEAVAYIHDSSNEDCRYTRNTVRHRLLPEIKKACPTIVAQLLRVARHARVDEEYLSMQAQERLSTSAVGDGVYSRRYFADVHDAIRYRMLRSALEAVGCRSMEDRHYRSICRYIDDGNGAVQLPGNVTVKVTQEQILLLQDEPIVDVPVALSVDTLPFKATFGCFAVCIYLCDADSYNESVKVNNLFAKCTIDYDRIQGKLKLRVREGGDAMHPAGRMVGKSIRRLMQENGVPAAQRDGYPLLCDENGVVLFSSYCCDERVRMTPCTKHFLVCLVQRLIP